MSATNLNPDPFDLLVKIAVGELGEREDGTTNAGPEIAKYQAVCDLGAPKKGGGYPWCAAFVDWCVQQLFVKCANVITGSSPRTPLAFGLISWAKQQGHQVITPGACAPGETWPRPGDLVIYNFSHCGIVRSVNAKERNFTAVEGNSNTDGSRDGTSVVSHGRTFSQVRGFVRLTLKGIPA